MDIYYQINAAANRLDNKALIWVRSAQDFNITDEELEEVPPEFPVISRDICAKLHRMCTGELGRNITLLNEKCISKNLTMPGPLVLRCA